MEIEIENYLETEHYPHKVAAVYPDDASAQQAIQALEDAGLDDIKITTLVPSEEGLSPAIEPETKETRNKVVLDTLFGTATGGAAGAATAGAIAIVVPSLFVSAPIVAPLIVLGYGAMIGGTAGAIVGLKPREGMLAGLVRDSVKAGYHVVIVHAASHETREQVEAVIGETMTEKTARL